MRRRSPSATASFEGQLRRCSRSTSTRLSPCSASIAALCHGGDARVRMAGMVDVIPSSVPRHDVPRGGRSGFVLVDDRQVHYLEWGPATGPAVLCLHGGGQTAYMWEELGASLRDRYHVLAPDLPWHGDSDPVDDMSRQSIAATIPPLLIEFGLERVALVGASLGGIVAHARRAIPSLRRRSRSSTSRPSSRTRAWIASSSSWPSTSRSRRSRRPRWRSPSTCRSGGPSGRRA